MRRGQRSSMVKGAIAAIILVVVGVIGLLGKIDQRSPERSQLGVELAFTQSCIDDYARRNGKFPETLQQVVDEHRVWIERAGVAVDSRAPWLLELPRDPWGNPLGYQVQASCGPTWPVINRPGARATNRFPIGSGRWGLIVWTEQVTMWLKSRSTQSNRSTLSL